MESVGSFVLVHVILFLSIDVNTFLYIFALSTINVVILMLLILGTTYIKQPTIMNDMYVTREIIRATSLSSCLGPVYLSLIVEVDQISQMIGLCLLTNLLVVLGGASIEYACIKYEKRYYKIK